VLNSSAVLGITARSGITTSSTIWIAFSIANGVGGVVLNCSRAVRSVPKGSSFTLSGAAPVPIAMPLCSAAMCRTTMQAVSPAWWRAAA